MVPICPAPHTFASPETLKSAPRWYIDDETWENDRI